MSSERINDELLSAWVDGQLDGSQQAEVQTWLAAHPDDAARAARWAADRDAMRAHFGPVIDEPVPAALRSAVWRRPAQRRWAMAAAAAGLLVTGALAGGGAAWQWQQQRMAQLQVALAAGTAQGWAERAARAHAVFTIEPRHPVEVKANEEHLSRWLTRRVEVPVKLFDLREQGFDLVGGRLLPDGPGKSAQLMYEDAKKVRVTVYLRKPEQGTSAAFRYERHGDLGMFYWVEEGCGYALVGALPRERLLAMAQSIYNQHPAATLPVPAPPPASDAVPAPATAPAPAAKPVS